VAGLVLAAGAGRRFGGPKALAEIDGELFVERAVRLLTAGGCAPVLVVLGAAADEVLDRASLGEAVPVLNPGWEDGMAGSLRVGLAAADAAEAVVLVLVDQPGLGSEAVARLRTAWQDGAVAAQASYGGVPGHPVLLDRSTWAEVSDLAVGDEGARAWLRAHPDLVVAVDCTGTGDPADVDRPDQLPGRSVVDGGGELGERPAGAAPAAGHDLGGDGHRRLLRGAGAEVEPDG
jgi:CTP:molybdopterin cytidylyltransferase MocA